MIIKNIDLIRCIQPMKCLSEKEAIPFQSALIISKNISVLDGAIEKYFSEKNRLASSFSSPNDKTGGISPEKQEEFLKLLTELNDKENDLPITKINSESLSLITFPPKYIDSIAFMLDI